MTDETERTWGIFFIPRDLAPSEGFMLTYGTHGGHAPVTPKGVERSVWSAWWLPLTLQTAWPATEHETQVLAPNGKPYRKHKDLQQLIDSLQEDHLEVRPR